MTCRDQELVARQPSERVDDGSLYVDGAADGAGDPGPTVGVAATAGLSTVRTAACARWTGFSIGATALGFGTPDRSRSVVFGRGIQNAQQHLDTGTDWTEVDSRRAMTRIAWFGSGLLVAVPLLAGAAS